MTAHMWPTDPKIFTAALGRKTLPTLALKDVISFFFCLFLFLFFKFFLKFILGCIGRSLLHAGFL